MQVLLDGGSYRIESSPLISSANQWTGVYVIGTPVMKKLSPITTQKRM